MSRRLHRNERGQILPLFVLSLVVLLLAVGLSVDVGYAFSQQRRTQNAADFAAMAGTRVVGEALTGVPAGAGSDANVSAAVHAALAANNATLGSAQYVDRTGASVGSVGSGAIPSTAVGVVVRATSSWHPFFLGVVGMRSWSSDANATAFTPGSASAGVMPIGINNGLFNGMPYCDPTSATFASCVGGNLESGKLLPGGFGWLKFGATGKCGGFGLGMDPNAGCETSQGFLQNEVGPPADSYGCCTDLTLTPDAQRYIGSLTGNKPADLSYYIENKLIVWVPIFDDPPEKMGANGRYHIVGFGAIIITGVDTQHGKWLTGIRVSATYGNTPNAEQLGASGAVYLVR